MVLRSMIGASVKRKEDPSLITGAGKYVGDMKLPGMRHVAFVRSPYAHANIVSIDTSAAEKMAGVYDVITAKDIEGLAGLMPNAVGADLVEKRSRYALSGERVRHVGEPVAAVVADSPEHAVDAAEAVAVEWETLPVAANLLKAFEPDSPVIFDDMDSNIADVFHPTKGVADEAFASAAHVVSQRIVSQRLAGMPMENRAALTAPDLVTGGVTLWTTTQAPHGVQGSLAPLVNLPENMVRVIAPNVGGGFGVKTGVYPEDLVLTILALKYKVPFRWVETRSENMMVTTQGRAQVADMEVAIDDEGKILGMKMNVIADLGAYPSDFIIPHLTALMSSGTYKIPVIDACTTAVYTNTVTIGPYRGAGRPEAIYYLERMIELIADHLGVDSTEIRRRNFIQPDAFPYKTPIAFVYDSGEYAKNLDKALEFSNYAKLREDQKASRDAGKVVGVGVATYVEVCGFGPYESGVVRVEPSGTVTVFTGTSPHGQGGETTFAQIVADTIGADFDKIVVKHGDTGSAPHGIGTFGSRGLAVGGSAVFAASNEVKDKAMKIAAHILEADAGDIELVDGKYQVKGVPEKSLTLTEIAGRAYTDQLPADIESGLEATNFFRPPTFIYPFGTHVAVVEIDRETGFIDLQQYYSVDDCGKRISPNLVAGQIHGGIGQGVGQALLEEIVYDDDGNLLTGSMMDYTMPRADDFPTFNLDQTETPTPLNPLGAKGIGEAATIGSTPAVVNAVVDALKPFGIHHIDMPLSPAKIWAAINGE